MDPTNYLAAVPQEDFLRDIQGGYQLGAGIQQLQQQQAAQAAAQQQAQQYAQDVQTAMANPTPQVFSSLALKYPAQREAVKQAWDGMSTADQKAEGDVMSQAYSALLAGKPDIAKQVVQTQIDARKNSGLDTSHYDNALSLLDADPKQAQAALGFTLSHITDPKTFAQTFGTLSELPGRVADTEAGVAGKQADNTLKNLGIVAQKAGALAKPGVKPAQAEAMFRTLAAQGVIPKDDLQGYIDGIPIGLKAVSDYLASVRDAGIKPDEQKKFTTPDANAQLSSTTQLKTTGMNNATQLAVQKAIADRQDSKGGDVDQTQVENVAQLIASGRMAPLGAMAMRTPYGQAVMSRVADINPTYRAQDFGTSSKAEKDFATGKQGNAVRSFNVGLSHLDTLGQLADAMGNKDTQTINRLGNYFATQTGQEAPVKFEAAKKVVTDEIVKAIVGAGGTGHDREEAAKTVSAASSPAQLRGVINTYKELMVGQLNGLDQQYRTTTGRNDFNKYLSPQAVQMYGKHGAPSSPTTAATPALPAGWSVQVH